MNFVLDGKIRIFTWFRKNVKRKNYLFDELPAGNYRVTCHVYGYEVPAPVELTIGSDESLVVDFALKPLVVPELIQGIILK